MKKTNLILSKTLLKFFIFSFCLISIFIFYSLKVESYSPTTSSLFYSDMSVGGFRDWGYSDKAWSQTSKDSYCGKRGATTKNTKGEANLITPIINTIGYSNLKITFAYRIAQFLQGMDRVNLEWSIDGNNWHRIYSYTSGWPHGYPGDWIEQNFVLSTQAENQSKLQLRFNARLTNQFNEFRLDCVKLTAETIN